MIAVPNLCAGTWEPSRSERTSPVHNPSTGRVIAKVHLSTTAEVDAVVKAAHAVLPAWAEVPAVDRARVFFKFREKLEAHTEELAKLVTMEHGKTLPESRASLARGIEMVEFACVIPSLLMGQVLPNIAANVDCETVRHPVGVCVGITPFNFPAMVPLWMFPVAIACGNTFVLKPSEKVPLSSIRMGELLSECGLPASVFNIVHGDKECVDALLTHPLVRQRAGVGPRSDLENGSEVISNLRIGIISYYCFHNLEKSVATFRFLSGFARRPIQFVSISFK